jgi:hypothetical protein
MKIGLSWLTQIRGTTQGSATDAPDATASPTNRLGGFVALQFQNIIASITAGYHTEHNDDDSHGTIHATGPIAERGRSHAIGTWIRVPQVAADFTTETLAVTWDIPTADSAFFRPDQGLAYMLIGTTMFVSFYLFDTSVTGGTTSVLYAKIPGGFRARRSMYNQVFASDAGTAPATGYAAVDTGVPGVITFGKSDTTAWSVSSNATSIFGLLVFEIVE